MSWGLASDVGEAGRFRRIETHPWLGSYIETLYAPLSPTDFPLWSTCLCPEQQPANVPNFLWACFRHHSPQPTHVSQEPRDFIPGHSGQSPKEGHVASIYSLEMRCFTLFLVFPHLLPVSFWGWRRRELRCKTPVLLPLQTRV